MYIQFYLFIKGFRFFIKANIFKKWPNKSIHWFAAHTIALLHVFSCVLVKKQRYPSVCGYVVSVWKYVCLHVKCWVFSDICIYLYNCLWEFDFIVFFTLSICRTDVVPHAGWFFCCIIVDLMFNSLVTWVAVTEYSIKKKRKSKPNGF